MTQFEQIKNTLMNYSSTSRPIEIRWPKWVGAALIISSIIGFAMTWFYLHPTPTPPKSYTGKLTTEARKTRDAAGEITDILSSQPLPPTKISKIEAQATSTDSSEAWSADNFLDVLKEPAEDSDAANAIEMLTKQNTIEKKDPYVASLVNEAVDLAVLPFGNNGKIEDSSDQAAFYTSSAIDKTELPPLHFNPDGSIIVQNGDSLSRIALILYRDESQYTRIFEANKDVLSNPHELQAGTRLRIPEIQY